MVTETWMSKEASGYVKLPLLFSVSASETLFKYLISCVKLTNTMRLSVLGEVVSEKNKLDRHSVVAKEVCSRPTQRRVFRLKFPLWFGSSRVCDVKPFTSADTQAATMKSKSTDRNWINSAMAIELFLGKLATWLIYAVWLCAVGVHSSAGSSNCASSS